MHWYHKCIAEVIIHALLKRFKFLFALIRSKRNEIVNHLEDYEDTPLRFIYMTPEMIIKGGYDTREMIDTLMRNDQISHVVVDEAHCIIDKIYRESFLRLKNIRSKYPDIPWIATTTASNAALKKIADELSMRDAKIFKSSSDRKNIFYDVMRSSNEKEPNFKEIISDFLDLEEDDDEADSEIYLNSKTKRVYASGVIFCATNSHADIIADGLSKQGVTAKSYYGAKNDVNLIQKQWKDGIFPVLVATTESFGLGISRKPLKFIVHFNYSKNLRSYYQESGRVDAEKSFARIYINSNFIERGGMVQHSVKDYVNTRNCRHQHIANFFGDEVEKCRNMCDNCLEIVKKN